MLLKRRGILVRSVTLCVVVLCLNGSLYWQRQKAVAAENRVGNAIIANIWELSELQLETRRLQTTLAQWSAGLTTLEEVELAFEVLWSRNGLLHRMVRDGRTDPEMARVRDAYDSMLNDFDERIYSEAGLQLAQAPAMIERLEANHLELRTFWIEMVSENRQNFLKEIADSVGLRSDRLDTAISIIGILIVLYLAAELVMADRVARRQRRLAIEAKSASATKTTFLANMSHEIRTPLNGILGATQVLRESSLSADQRDMVEMMHDSGTHLHQIVDQLLDITKIEAGKIELEDIAFEPAHEIARAAATFEAKAAAKSLDLRVNVEGTRGANLMGDPLRLRQVVSNLVSNAIKFTDLGSVSVTAAVKQDGAARCLTITVADSGIGISDSARRRIFEPFRQNDVSDTRRFGGTGLGLSISLALVKQMGGALKLDSEVGKGTTFTLDIPFSAAPAPVRHLSNQTAKALDSVQSEADGTPYPHLSTIHVLVVDDNRTNRTVIDRLLRNSVASVSACASGAEALEFWESDRPVDVILMDIQMPGMTGVEATKRLRALEEQRGLPMTPVISLTANVMAHQMEEYQDAGMSGHVSKPTRKADLHRVLSEVLASSAPRDVAV